MKRLLQIALILPFLAGCGGGGVDGTSGTSGTSETGGAAAVHLTPQLAPPEILHVVCFDHDGANYISVEWSYVPGATAYHVYLTEEATRDLLLQEHPLVFDNATVYEGIITPRRITGFQTGVRYLLVMTAVNGSEESLPSNTVSFVF